MPFRLTRAIRAGLAHSRNAIRYSQASDRYGVFIQFARHGSAGSESVIHIKRFPQVDGSRARARVVAGVAIAAIIATCRREEYITASRIEIHFMTLKKSEKLSPLLRLTSESHSWCSDLDVSVPKVSRAAIYERIAPRLSLQRAEALTKAIREWVRRASVCLVRQKPTPDAAN